MAISHTCPESHICPEQKQQLTGMSEIKLDMFPIEGGFTADTLDEQQIRMKALKCNWKSLVSLSQCWYW